MYGHRGWWSRATELDVRNSQINARTKEGSEFRRFQLCLLRDQRPRAQQIHKLRDDFQQSRQTPTTYRWQNEFFKFNIPWIYVLKHWRDQIHTQHCEIPRRSTSEAPRLTSACEQSRRRRDLSPVLLNPSHLQLFVIEKRSFVCPSNSGPALGDKSLAVICDHRSNLLSIRYTEPRPWYKLVAKCRSGFLACYTW